MWEELGKLLSAILFGPILVWVKAREDARKRRGWNEVHVIMPQHWRSCLGAANASLMTCCNISVLNICTIQQT
jgi:hypothetical protein